MLTVVSYDIIDTRRRTRLARLLLTYGTRVQKSIFEMYLEEKELPVLIKRIERLISPEKDSVRIYRLPKNAVRASLWLGQRVEVVDESYYLF